ncbi:MAG: DUF3794 domain-containing protein [Clostridia bacterium]|nr:DUF3794 domain-containing protein [Clostridia bacterium]
MNFNCETQKLGFCETVFETTAEQSVDADISLPDYCPEIQRILRCSVITNINSVQNSSGRVTADGNAVVRLLYVGENGKIAGYEQSYPIQKFIESNRISSESSVNVTVNTDYVNCRAVNPRRIDVRAMLTFIFKALNKRNEDMLCHAEGAGIQLLSEDFAFASVTGVCEKAFLMSEVVELESDKKPVAQIINVSPCAIASEIKIINNKALIKGDCTVRIYYSAEDGTLERAEHSMPISQIVELEGLNENSLSSLKMSVTSCEAVAKADSSGNMCLIDLSARISAFMISFEETPLTVITDSYSTDYEVKNTSKNIELLEYCDKFNSTFTNKVILESIGVSVDCVVAVWCSDIKYNFTSKDDKCVISGTYQATVIYKESENSFGTVQKPVDFEYSAKLSKKPERIVCYGSASITACSCAVTGDSRLELKTEIDVSGIVLSACNKKYISSIEVSEDAVKRDKACALTIYFCDKGEAVWDIARRYNTTVDAIMAENDLADSLVDRNGMLLIPGV